MKLLETGLFGMFGVNFPEAGFTTTWIISAEKRGTRSRTIDTGMMAYHFR
jgi:hypothetical protein